GLIVDEVFGMQHFPVDTFSARGGVIQPGEPIMEVIPVEERLLVIFTLAGMPGTRKATSPERLLKAQRQGLHVSVWTVNEPALMRRLADFGVDS
ncbi:glycerophosphodiester phosphodiesterase family protein, partial [Pseudomonas aeruginosa]|uniref:glycerophosphodiester phosphodiesterase family protein n=1 Tax=Pseudomonas aeruginosa TaxID=287 RepID=UPI00321FB100